MYDDDLTVCKKATEEFLKKLWIWILGRDESLRKVSELRNFGLNLLALHE